MHIAAHHNHHRLSSSSPDLRDLGIVSIAGGMEGGGGAERKFPMGFRFKPRDDELVEFYLLPKLQGRPVVPNGAVIEANVYELHPDTLTSVHRSGGGGGGQQQEEEEEEWYFLSSRQRMYGNGVRPARKTRDGRGRWKASTATKEVAEEVVCDGGFKFCKSVLNYFEGVPKKETRTKWIMLELTVPEFEIKLDNPGAKNMLDEYVMCKIYVSPQHKKKGDADDEEGTSSAFEEEEEEASSSSTPHGHGAAESSMLAEKQTGNKRRVELLPQRGSFFAPAQKQARQSSYSAATSNNAAPSMEAYYGGPADQLTGAHCGVQFQAPPPTQRPGGAYNGQAPATQPPAGACGGRGLVQQLPRPTQVMYQPFAGPTDGDPFGQMAAATMTRPPPPPASQAARLQSFPGSQPPRQPGTAFRPHVSLRCCYDQNYRPAQVHQPPPGNASSSRLQRLPVSLPRQQMQQPFLNGGADRRGGVAAVPRGQYYNGCPYQRTSMAPAADGHSGAANERNGAARLNVNAEQFFVDLATINPSLAGGCTQPSPAPAPARPIEAPAGAAAGGAKVKTETGETSGLNTQDAA